MDKPCTVITNVNHVKECIASLPIVSANNLSFNDDELDEVIKLVIERYFTEEWDEYEDYIHSYLIAMVYDEEVSYSLFGDIVDVVGRFLINQINVIGYDEYTHDFINVRIENSLCNMLFRKLA